MTDSLYVRVGGEMAIMAASERLYQYVLGDAVTQPFFQGVDTGAQSRKLVAFLTWAFGGPLEYRGRPLREAHASLVAEQGLSDVHFDALVRHLECALGDLDVAQDIISEVRKRLEGLRNEVLGRSPTR